MGPPAAGVVVVDAGAVVPRPRCDAVGAAVVVVFDPPHGSDRDGQQQDERKCGQ